jgi:hypothetical protein
MLEDSSRLALESDSLEEAVVGRAGKANVGSGSRSRGRGMLINCAPQPESSATLALAGAVLISGKISSIGPACAFVRKGKQPEFFQDAVFGRGGEARYLNDWQHR